MRRKTKRLEGKPVKYALDAERAIRYYNENNKDLIEDGSIMPFSKRSFNKALGVTADTFSSYDHKEAKILTALMFIHEQTKCPIELLIKQLKNK